MKLVRLVAIAAALLLVLLALGCVERPEELTELRIGWQPAFEHVAVPIILEKGWLEEELGIPVRAQLFTGGGAEEFQAFRAGEIEVAVGGVAPAISTIAYEYEKGHKVVAAVGMDIATLSIRATNGTPDFRWNLSDPAGSILRFKEEHGRPMRIGVWGGPGSIQWTITWDWLEAHGIDPERDVEIKTGGIVLMEWMRSKVIDAAVI
ncbi:MAG: ABC transporter substrate-binding protein, partial [Candidatus Alkanophagales archaeon]